MGKNEDENKHQAHGLTVGEMADLQYQQIHEPEEIEMMTGNGAGDAIKDPYFKEAYKDYELPVHEKNFYHVATEARTFAPNGAEPIRTSVMSVQKLSKEAFEFQKVHGGFAGQIVHILHKPEEEQPRARKSKKVKEETENSGQGEAGNSAEDRKILETMTVPQLKERLDEITGATTKLKKKEELIDEILLQSKK